jgi:hypothetical protein
MLEIVLYSYTLSIIFVKISSKMATITKKILDTPNQKPIIVEERLERGTAPLGKKMSEIFNKKGRWKQDNERITADQIRKSAWQRNNER